MNNLKNTQTVLMSDWKVGAAIDLPYPAGTNPNSFGGSGHKLSTSGGASFSVNNFEFSIKFNEGTITLVNNFGRSINAASTIFLELQSEISTSLNITSDSIGNVKASIGTDGHNLSLIKQSSIGGLKLLPSAGFQALAGDATNGKVINSQLPAAAPFFGVKLIYQNYDTTFTMDIDGVKVAAAVRAGALAGFRGATADGNAETNATLTFSPFVTFNGLQSISLPAATTGAGGQVIPSVAISDFIQVTSQARTDFAGEPPLLRVATHLAPSANQTSHPSYGGGTYANFNKSTFNTGFRHGNGVTIASLAALTTSGETYDAYGGVQNPISAIFYHSEQVQELFAFGDSLIQGTGASSYCGWPEFLTFKSYNSKLKVISSNYATSGQKTVDTIAVMKGVIDKFKPKYAAFKAWSPNDLDTQAGYDAAWGACLDGVSYCLDRGIIPIVLTSGAAVGYSWDLMAAQNVRVVNLPSSVIKVDVAGLVSKNGVRDASLYSDGTHYNDAGYALIASRVLSSL